MATHSSIVAREIPQTKEPGGLPHILVSALASLPSLTWKERGPLFWWGLRDPWPLACEP